MAFGLTVTFGVFAAIPVAIAVFAAVFIGPAFHARTVEQILAIFGNVAVKACDCAIGDQNKTIGTGFDQIGIVADDDDRTFVGVERMVQRIAAVDIKVVGRLIEDEHMRGIKGHQRKQQTCLFAARKVLDLGVAFLAFECKAAELGTDFMFDHIRHQGRHVLIRGFITAQLIGLVLRKIPDAQFVR